MHVIYSTCLCFRFHIVKKHLYTRNSYGTVPRKWTLCKIINFKGVGGLNLCSEHTSTLAVMSVSRVTTTRGRGGAIGGSYTNEPRNNRF